MSTNAAIIIKENNKYRGIYCHSDGYTSYTGKILLEHYTDENKVRELINLGDISILGERVNPITQYQNESPSIITARLLGEKIDPIETVTTHSFDFDKREAGTTVAYHRDRGEELNKPATSKNLKTLIKQLDLEYNYVFENGKWTVNGKDLETAIKEDAEEQAAYDRYQTSLKL